MEKQVTGSTALKRLLWLVPLALFGVLAIFLYGRLGNNPQVVPMATLNKALPPFQLTDLMTGAPVSGQDLPKQPYLLNVWGSWCPTCIREHPVLTRLAAQGVPVVGVNYKDEPENALKYLADNGNPYTRIIQDYRGNLGMDLGVTGAPENFIVDSRGIIRAHYVGELTQEAWQTVLVPCMQLIAKSPAAKCSSGAKP